MKKNNIVIGSIFIVFLMFFLITLPWLGSYKPVAVLDSVVDAVGTGQGGYWIVDQGGRRILLTDSDLKVKRIIKPVEEVKEIALNERGEVYVRCIGVKNQNNSISREAIYRIEPDSGKMQPVYEKLHENSRLRSEIFQISCLTENLRIGIRKEQGFGFYELNPENELTEIYYIPFQEAEVWVSSGILTRDEGAVFYCLQDGTVYRHDVRGKTEEKIYDGALLEGREGIPRTLSLDGEDNLYFTDIGLRDIGKWTEGEITYLKDSRKLEKEEFLLQESFIQVKAEQGLTACSSYALYIHKEGGFTAFYELELEKNAVLGMIISKIALLVLLTILLYYGIQGLKLFLDKKGTITRVLFAMCAVIGAITFLFLAMVIPDYKKQIVKELEQRTKNVAYLVSGSIPCESLQNLDSVSDFRGEDYWEIKSVIDDIFLKEDGVTDFYCTIYTIRDDIITINYSSEESNGSVYPYDWVYEGSDEQKIMTSGKGKTYTGWLNSDGNYSFCLHPVIGEDGEAIGLIEVGVNTEPFNNHINQLIGDLLITVIVIAVVIIFLILEILVFLQGRHKSLWDESEFLPNQLLRTLVFLIFFVTNLSTSFLSVYGLKMAEEQSSLIPPQLWASLVISAEVFAGALLSLKGNIVIKKLGQRKAAIFSAILMISGLFLRAVPQLWLLLAGQLLVGAGWGVLLLIVNTRISLNTEEQDEGFAGYSAAAFNGINSAVVLGGFAMKFMSQSMVILLAAALSLLILGHVFKYIHDAEEEEAPGSSGLRMSTFAFLRKRNVWSFLLMLVLPVIACGYYLNYMYPILGSGLGMEESYIGYSYLVNGLMVLTFGNLLTAKITKWVGRRAGLLLSVILYSLVFLILSYSTHFPALLVSLIILGLADSFGLPLQSSYFMELEETKEYGHDRAAGIYSLVENMSQSLGPVMFGYILIFGISVGLKILAAVILVFAVIFFIMGMFPKMKIKPEH